MLFPPKHFFPKNAFSTKTLFPKKRFFSKNVFFHQNAFSPNTIFPPKRFFFPKKRLSSPKTLFQTKCFFSQKRFFHQNALFPKTFFPPKCFIPKNVPKHRRRTNVSEDFAIKMRSNFVRCKNQSWCAGLEWRTALYWEIFTAGWGLLASRPKLRSNMQKKNNGIRHMIKDKTLCPEEDTSTNNLKKNVKINTFIWKKTSLKWKKTCVIKNINY